jgi:hypothetical protein
MMRVVVGIRSSGDVIRSMRRALSSRDLLKSRAVKDPRRRWARQRTATTTANGEQCGSVVGMNSNSVFGENGYGEYGR